MPWTSTPVRSRVFSIYPSTISMRLPVQFEYLKKIEGEIVVVSPDAGGVERARELGKRLNASIAIIDKRREKANVSKVMHIIGDVKGKTAILLDDMIDTGGTIVQAAEAIMEDGANARSMHAALILFFRGMQWNG